MTHIQFPLRDRIPAFAAPAMALILTLILALAAGGCARPVASLDEATDVALSVQERFTPPPRRAGDVLAMVDAAPRKAPGDAEELRRVAGAEPPAGADEPALTQHHQRRAAAAFQLGRLADCLADLRRAVELSRPRGLQDKYLLFFSGVLEQLLGDPRVSLEHLRTLYVRHPKAPMVYYHLVKVLCQQMHDMEAAEAVFDRGKSNYNRVLDKSQISASGWASMHGVWAELLEGRGEMAASEVYRRKRLHLLQGPTLELPMDVRPWLGFFILQDMGDLTRNLMRQGRLLDAERVCRRAVSRALDQYGPEHPFTAMTLVDMARVLLEQDRLAEAQDVAARGRSIMQKAAMHPDAYALALAGETMGDILAARGRHGPALSHYRAAMGSGGTDVFRAGMRANPGFILGLLRQGHVDEAAGRITQALDTLSGHLDADDPRLAEMRALAAMAVCLDGRPARGLTDMLPALDALAAGLDGNRGHFALRRMEQLSEFAMEALAEAPAETMARVGLDPAAEAFRLADAMGSRGVAGALAAHCARQAVTDPKLRRLVRAEQDAGVRLEHFRDLLGSILSAPPDQRPAGAVETLEADMRRLAQARAVLVKEIAERFPDYERFTRPRPHAARRRAGPAGARRGPGLRAHHAPAHPGLGRVRAGPGGHARRARPQDHGGPDRPHAPQSGHHPGHRGRHPALRHRGRLGRLPRHAAAPGPGPGEGRAHPDRGPRPPVPGAPGRALLTGPWQARAKGLPLSGYEDAPWLALGPPMTRLPSLSSLAHLRGMGAARHAGKAFAGFGDPVFQALAQGQEPAGATPGLRTRGVRVTATGDLDAPALSSARLEDLTGLPETGDELRHIAAALGAPDSDLYLGRRASEAVVKAEPLDDRRVVAFATHALVPGDLDGLDQPALALSNPAVTGEAEDGLL